MSTGRNFIGPFQLIRMIRSGNSTTVWEARHQHDKKRVALKILVSKHMKSKRHIDELKHEAAVGQVMDDENVIKIFSYHGDLGSPMISMELFNARNLKVTLREHHDFVGEHVRTIMRNCGLGLQHMHDKGWLHCDIKPDNFLCDIECNIKLIDFSIAEKAKKGFKFGFGSKAIRGTRSYMSPEQIRRKTLTIASDIYGLGCMFYEFCSGRPPFTAPSSDELLQKHLSAPVPSLEAIGGATEPFNKLVHQMLSKKPEERPQSVKDIVLQLERIRVFRPGKKPKGKHAPAE